jgi:hypothetical protein
MVILIETNCQIRKFNVCSIILISSCNNLKKTLDIKNLWT